MFSSIVVPLDLEVTGDRALPIARSLAELDGLPIELLTITSPHMEGFVEACSSTGGSRPTDWVHTPSTFSTTTTPAAPSPDIWRVATMRSS